MNLPYLIDTASEAVLHSLARDLATPGQGLLAFVGAGVSRQAGLPLWKELMHDMDAAVEKIRSRPQQVRKGVLEHPDLLWQAEIFRLELERRSVYARFLRHRFDASLPPADTVIRNLVRLKFRHFLTTNYDTLLEQALDAQNLKYEEFDWTNRQESRNFFLNFLAVDGDPHVVHIHGRFNQPDTIVLSHADYLKRYVETPEYVDKLSVLFATMRIVFAGFGLEDPDLRVVLRQVNSRFGTGDVQHYAVLGFNRLNQAQAQIERDRLERQFGIAAIFYDDKDGHAALKDVLGFLEAQQPSPAPQEPLRDPAVSTTGGSSGFTSLHDARDHALPNLVPIEPAAPAPPPPSPPSPADIWNDDPHKGQFGGQPENPAKTRRLSVQYLGAESNGLYSILLVVESIQAPPLQGEVVFHVHPTFARPTYRARAVNGKATFELAAYGAFTVGVECEEKKTRLELDLAEQPNLPKEFRES